MIKEAIILAGGLGTRLRYAVPDLPKCMAPVNGRPFLFYVINQLRMQGIDRFIFSLGYKHEFIEEYLSTAFATLEYETVIETEPLGTGGAIQFALSKANSTNIIVTNGDSLFRASITDAVKMHLQQNADCTLFLKPMTNFDRYGVVEMNSENRIVDFKEKKFYRQGTINGGMYILNKTEFLNEKFPEKFSFEKDYVEDYTGKRKFLGSVQEKYFIDIGIPDDYHKAQIDLRTVLPELKTMPKNWTLFLDRDGVVNHDREDDYIKNVAEFRFYEGVKEAIRILNQKFGKLILVTNQRGVGKGIMTEDNLNAIHQFMITELEAAGGRIDKIYCCTSKEATHPNRKPNPGMAFRAVSEDKLIDLSCSIIIGNKPTDMLFGRNAGMITVFVASTNPETPFPHPDIDFRFNSLVDFVKAL